MNKNLIIFVLSIFIFICGLFFIKKEMNRDRQILAHDVDQVVSDASVKVVEKTINTFNQVLSNAIPLNTTNQSQTTNSINSLINLVTDVGRRVDRIALDSTQMSDDEEINFGKKLDIEILKDMPEEEDPIKVVRLERLAKKLTVQCNRKNIHYTIRIVKSSVVNAFSIAGGYIYVTTSFLEKFSSDADLTMTLGHEIGHVELKHAVHKVQYYFNAQKIFGDAGAIVQVGYSILSSPFSKDQEYEADAWGFKACKNAGWESNSLFNFFKELEKYEQKSHQSKEDPLSQFERSVGEYFDSHPKTSDRLARIKSL